MKKLNVFSVTEAAKILDKDRVEVMARVKFTGIPHKHVGNSCIIDASGLAKLRKAFATAEPVAQPC